MLILIADDDRDLCNLLTKRCQTLNLEVQVASGATDALRFMEERAPDLVILDVEMPNGSGLAVCEMMSLHENLKNLPVVMLTGKKDQQTIRRCHEMCAYYVTKCSDVWDRLRPLITGLLGLSPDVPTAPATDAALPPKPELQPIAEPAPPADALAAVQAGRRPEVGSKSDSILDAVFAALDATEDVVPFADEEATTGERPWVLCIDDDEEFSRVLELRLQEHGVEVMRAFAGRDGVRSAFTNQAQAIILDYLMPDGDGAYVLRRLKENPITRDIPVIVMTGLRDRHVERQVTNLGAECFMTKPYDWPKLWAKLQEFLPDTLVGAGR